MRGGSFAFLGRLQSWSLNLWAFHDKFGLLRSAEHAPWSRFPRPPGRTDGRGRWTIARQASAAGNPTISRCYYTVILAPGSPRAYVGA
jgi:hypothetical protein